MSAFIVYRDSEGLTVSKDIPRMGIRAASNAEVALVDVKSLLRHLGFLLTLQIKSDSRAWKLS